MHESNQESRDLVISRAKGLLRKPEVQAVRVLLQKAGEGGADHYYVAFRAQKVDGIPELEDLRKKRRKPAAPAPGPAPRADTKAAPPPESEPAEPEPPAEAPPRPKRQRHARRHASIVVLVLLAIGSIAALLLQRNGAFGLDPTDLTVTGVIVTVMLASGLLLIRQAIRLDSLMVEVGAEPDPEGPGEVRLAVRPPQVQRRRSEPEPPPKDEPQEPDRIALMPVLRLMAGNLDRLRTAEEPLPGRAVRLASRIYVAGACDERAARRGADGAVLTADCLQLLGETPEDARRFAAQIDDFLVSPGHLRLYRAGRADLAERPEGDGPGSAFPEALTAWIQRFEMAPAANRVVLAMAPLASQHVPAIEAVVHAYEGDAFTRDDASLVATFGDPFGAVDVARTIREAVRAAAQDAAPGFGLSVTTPPRHDQEDAGGAVRVAVALAKAAGSGAVAVSPVLRSMLAAKGQRWTFTALGGKDAPEGFRLDEDEAANRQHPETAESPGVLA